MAQPIVTINGIKVYSDKTMRSCVNSRVEFTDGSWCDVSTGDVINKGAGYISIGQSAGESASPTITKGPDSYKLQPLEVRDIDADLDIQIHTSDNIQVTITGSQKNVDDIKVSYDGGKLLIRGTGQQNGGNVMIQGRGNVIRGIGNAIMSIVSISGNINSEINMNSGSDTKVSIRMPEGYPVTVRGVIGNTKIGDINAPLTANVRGTQTINAGKVKNANLSVQGDGDINVREVNGSLSGMVTGNGDITVQGGNVSTLTASVTGNGDFKFKGSAQNATLSVTGNGDIDIKHVANRPFTSVTGNGDISIGNW